MRADNVTVDMEYLGMKPDLFEVVRVVEEVHLDQSVLLLP